MCWFWCGCHGIFAGSDVNSFPPLQHTPRCTCSGSRLLNSNCFRKRDHRGSRTLILWEGKKEGFRVRKQVGTCWLQGDSERNKHCEKQREEKGNTWKGTFCDWKRVTVWFEKDCHSPLSTEAIQILVRKNVNAAEWEQLKSSLVF